MLESSISIRLITNSQIQTQIYIRFVIETSCDVSLPEFDVALNESNGEEVEPCFRMIGAEEQKTRIKVGTKFQVDYKLLEGSAQHWKSYVPRPRELRILDHHI